MRGIAISVLLACAAGCSCESGGGARDGGGVGIDARPSDAAIDAPIVDGGIDAGREDAGALDAWTLRDVGPDVARDVGRPDVVIPDGTVCDEMDRTCWDGLDGDCDGLIDCDDPDCREQTCVEGSTTMRCCLGSCRDVDAPPREHCGACHFACGSDESCQQIAGHFVCTCDAPDECPGGASPAWACVGGLCECRHSEICGGSQECQTVPDGRMFCGYP